MKITTFSAQKHTRRIFSQILSNTPTIIFINDIALLKQKFELAPWVPLLLCGDNGQERSGVYREPAFLPEIGIASGGSGI